MLIVENKVAVGYNNIQLYKMVEYTCFIYKI